MKIDDRGRAARKYLKVGSDVLGDGGAMVLGRKARGKVNFLSYYQVTTGDI